MCLLEQIKQMTTRFKWYICHHCKRHICPEDGKLGMWCEATLSKWDGAWWRDHFTIWTDIWCQFFLEAILHFCGMCGPGPALFNRESPSGSYFSLVCPLWWLRREGRVDTHVISRKGHWLRGLRGLRIWCFTLGHITVRGGGGTAFQDIRGSSGRSHSHVGPYTNPLVLTKHVSELHLSSFCHFFKWSAYSSTFTCPI